ncbi:MAG: hypothetical protein MSH15_07900 [Oscillospiraceae bacterium]|nr:hypothetical protein [Oscillospiraceae bacterium]
MQKLLEFCTSIYMEYIIIFCWMLHFFVMSRKNKKLTRKIDALQKEVVSLDSELYDVTQERDRLGLLLEEGE